MKRKHLLSIILIIALSISATGGMAKSASKKQPEAPELAEHVPGEILIRFSPGVNSAQAVDHSVADAGSQVQGRWVANVRVAPAASKASTSYASGFGPSIPGEPMGIWGTASPATSGRSSAFLSRIFADEMMHDSGVRISCDTVLTKSVFICSSSRSRVISRMMAV